MGPVNAIRGAGSFLEQEMMKIQHLFWFCTLWMVGIGTALLLALPFDLMMCDAMN
jgi:hypothetical protein